MRRYKGDTDRKEADEVYTLNRYVLPLIGEKLFSEITRHDVREMVKTIQKDISSRRPDRTGYRTANNCQSVVLRIFNRAIDDDVAEKNPAKIKRVFPNTSEKRIGKLNSLRFGAIWRELERGADEEALSDRAIQLYILTLQRPLDIVRARVTDFDLARRVWSIPPSRTKTKKPYHIPLSPQAADMIQHLLSRSHGDVLFPGKAGRARLSAAALSHRFVRMAKRLVADGALDSGDIQLYDFRRYGRTILHKQLGVTQQVAEMVINHAPDRRMAVLYDVADYSEDIRAAQNLWGAEVDRMAQLVEVDDGGL